MQFQGTKLVAIISLVIAFFVVITVLQSGKTIGQPDNRGGIQEDWILSQLQRELHLAASRVQAAWEMNDVFGPLQEDPVDLADLSGYLSHSLAQFVIILDREGRMQMVVTNLDSRPARELEKKLSQQSGLTASLLSFARKKGLDWGGWQLDERLYLVQIHEAREGWFVAGLSMEELSRFTHRSDTLFFEPSLMALSPNPVASIQVPLINTSGIYRIPVEIHLPEFLEDGKAGFSVTALFAGLLGLAVAVMGFYILGFRARWVRPLERFRDGIMAIDPELSTLQQNAGSTSGLKGMLEAVLLRYRQLFLAASQQKEQDDSRSGLMTLSREIQQYPEVFGAQESGEQEGEQEKEKLRPDVALEPGTGSRARDQQESAAGMESVDSVHNEEKGEQPASFVGNPLVPEADAVKSAPEPLPMTKEVTEVVESVQYGYVPVYDQRGEVKGALLELLDEHNAPHCPWSNADELQTRAIFRYVLHRILADCHDWKTAGLVPVAITVDVSELHLSPREISDIVTTSLLEAGVPSSCLELQLQESCLIGHPEWLDTLKIFRQVGIGVGVTGFGESTSPMSVSALADMPVSKIVMSGKYWASPRRNTDFIDPVIAMCHQMGCQVVAAGIDTRYIHARIIQHGFDLLSGEFLSGALNADEMASQIARLNVSQRIVPFS